MTQSNRGRTIRIICVLLPLQLFCGLAIVLHGQPPVTVIEQKLADDVTSVDARVRRLEDLHLEGRLAVLDALSDRSWRIELLVIGLFLTTGGQLVFQTWMHRTSGPPHRHSRLDDAERED